MTSLDQPTLDVERALARACGPGPRIIAGLDEVGRGALAGPVAIGACALLIDPDSTIPLLPDGVRDSKLLSPKRRDALVGPIQQAAHATAIGWASAPEIDELGIMQALTLASLRALDGLGVAADAVLLDGSADVLTSALTERGAGAPRVQVRVRADRECASVAAASVLAKVARDALMRDLDEVAPMYAWASNKGYGSAAHRAAIAQHGPHAQHRRSWNLG